MVSLCFARLFLVLFSACCRVSKCQPTLFPIALTVQVNEERLFLDAVSSDNERIEKSAKVSLRKIEERSLNWGLAKHKGNDNEPNMFSIIHRESGLALDIMRGSSEQGTGLWLYDYHGGVSQLFEMFIIASTTDDVVVLLRSKLSGFLLDVNIPGDGIWVWPFENDSMTQKWFISPDPSQQDALKTFIRSEPEEVEIPVKACEESLTQEEEEWERLSSLPPYTKPTGTLNCISLDQDWADNMNTTLLWLELRNMSMFDERAIRDSYEWSWVRELYQHLSCFLDRLESTSLRDASNEEKINLVIDLDRFLYSITSIVGIGEFEDKAVDRWGWVSVLQEQEKEKATMLLQGGLSVARIHLAAARKLRMLLSRCLHQNCQHQSDQSRKHQVMGHYYSSRADPQRGCTPGYDRVTYVANWTASLVHLDAEAVLFHDGLSEDFMHRLATLGAHISFYSVNSSDATSVSSTSDSCPHQSHQSEVPLPVDPITWRKLCKALPPNDLRFLVSLKHLMSGGEPGDLVLITDMNDVVFHRDVFQFMELMLPSQLDLGGNAAGYELFIGDELESNMGYMMKVLNKCYPKGGTGFTTGTVFNSGVIGGTREAVTWLLKKMVEEFAVALNQHGGKRFASGAVCDMSSMNKVLWNLISREPGMSVKNGHFYRIFSGYPLVSPFKSYAPHIDWHYISHK